MKRILILGGGTAGSIVANKLARELRVEIAKDEVDIRILDKDRTAINMAGLTFVPFGYLTKRDLTRDKESLISPRTKCIFGKEGEIQNIEIQNRRVITTSNKAYSYDYLVIAIGSVPQLPKVRGLSKDFNSFYTSFDDATDLGRKLESFEKGNIVVLVTSMPIPCPGAPAKFSILLSDYLKYTRSNSSSGEQKAQIKILWPTKSIGPPAYNNIVQKACRNNGIDLMKGFVFSEINEARKEIISKNFDSIKYDLLVTVPPFGCGKVLTESGLTDQDGWIPTNKNTLRYLRSSKESYDEVYAIGDNGNAEIPKTGVAAHYQALVTAQNIINEIHGDRSKKASTLYRGEAGCPFVESSYTSHTRGKAYIPIWTYDKPPQDFPSTEFGWLFYRMYYYVHWDSTLKGLM